MISFPLPGTATIVAEHRGYKMPKGTEANRYRVPVDTPNIDCPTDAIKEQMKTRDQSSYLSVELYKAHETT